MTPSAGKEGVAARFRCTAEYASTRVRTRSEYMLIQPFLTSCGSLTALTENRPNASLRTGSPDAIELCRESRFCRLSTGHRSRKDREQLELVGRLPPARSQSQRIAQTQPAQDSSSMLRLSTMRIDNQGADDALSPQKFTASGVVEHSDSPGMFDFEVASQREAVTLKYWCTNHSTRSTCYLIGRPERLTKHSLYLFPS